jgi:hypothetical protein
MSTQDQNMQVAEESSDKIVAAVLNSIIETIIIWDEIRDEDLYDYSLDFDDAVMPGGYEGCFDMNAGYNSY